MKQLFAMAALALIVTQTSAAEKGTEVKFDDLKSMAPGSWVSEKPASRMRFAQFKLPKAKGDARDGALVIFRGFGGTPKANIDRWKQQFRAPTGKSLDDVSKVSQAKVAGREVHRLDITGTFMDRPSPLSRQVTPRENYSMIAVQFDAPKNIYHIKAYGPKNTIEKHRASINKWLESFK